jgi:hypothetical protein
MPPDSLVMNVTVISKEGVTTKATNPLPQTTAVA